MRPTSLRLLLPLLGLFAAWGCGPHCTNTACPADQVCTGSGCQPALSASYTVTMRVSVASSDADGAPWDEGTVFSSPSPPDPGAYLNALGSGGTGALIAALPVVDDTYHAVTTARDVRFDDLDGGFDGGTMVLSVYDEDEIPGSGEQICRATLGPDAMSVLHAGVWDGGLRGLCKTVSVRFEAQ